MKALRIGEVAIRTGVTTPTLRYYESLGLLTPAQRSTSGYRHYGEQSIAEVEFIKKAQSLGFSLEEIREILRLSRAGRQPCAHVLDLARRHLAAAEERLRQLSRFRDTLAQEVAKWDGVTEPTCEGLCRIITEADAKLSETATRARVPPPHGHRRGSPRAIGDARKQRVGGKPSPGV